jgi:fatty acid synthase subunit alpha, fungi type
MGPCGSARTRWDMECNGRLSMEGCIEMAWIMGLIENYCGIIAGEEYCGWVDAKTKAPVHDSDVKAKYETFILNHTGIRIIEPWLDDSYNPDKKQFLQEIIVEEDLPPFSAPKEMADQILLEQGDKVHIYPGGGEFMVRLKKGAMIRVPRALSTDRTVVGQIPTGWDAKRYGIPEDIIQQVDRATLYTLVSVAEAFISSGVTDPYEFYKYMHVSEIGNCIGSGLGGAQSLKKMFKNRYLDRNVQNDILQETFINTTAAWVNMLLVSSCGPIRTPVGACATSVESLEIGYETIISGKAKMCLVGGYDDVTEAVSYEFGNMKATSNGREEAARGRVPQEMSRPTTTTRSGFMEAHGAGIEVITSARTAIDMGLPIYGVVAWVGTSSDKIGRSVPAPGKGILSNAREKPTPSFPSPLLNIRYRRRRLELALNGIQESLDVELGILDEELSKLSDREGNPALGGIEYRRAYLEKEGARRRSEAMNTFGNEFWKNETSISPIKGALAVWGLTVGKETFRLSCRNISQAFQSSSY